MGVNVSFTKDGKDFKWSESGFKKIKQYLIQKMGYKDSEVVMVSGGMSNDDKERAKNSFLAGTSSVLIGSSTISTGVDLQDNASALFLCSFDWNPTDNEQISGRIHRQGNRFEQIRIVYPMVMNSADPNIFQQLYEKTLRIKNIWDRNDRGNTLDLRDFDVNSLRKGILDEPEDLANYWKEEKSDELQTKNKILYNRLQDLNTARNSKEIYDDYTPVMKGIIVVLDAYRKQKNKKEAEANLKLKLDEVDDKFEDVEDLEEKFAKIGKEKAKIIK
jgi:superfamily II DNA/RNA helicase